jgi:translation initiation factor IF-2
VRQIARCSLRTSAGPPLIAAIFCPAQQPACVISTLVREKRPSRAKYFIKTKHDTPPQHPPASRCLPTPRLPNVRIPDFAQLDRPLTRNGRPSPSGGGGPGQDSPPPNLVRDRRKTALRAAAAAAANRRPRLRHGAGEARTRPAAGEGAGGRRRHVAFGTARGGSRPGPRSGPAGPAPRRRRLGPARPGGAAGPTPPRPGWGGGRPGPHGRAPAAAPPA